MRKELIVFLLLLSVQVIAQTAAPATKMPTKKPATATTAQPTAIIDTSLGKLTCTLFPDKAPIGVANFIGWPRAPRSGPIPQPDARCKAFHSTAGRYFIG